MTSPFQQFQKIYTEPEYNPPERIILSCKKCHKDIARTDLPSRAWVHLDDEMHLDPDAGFPFGLNIRGSNYDHEADPDVIDVEVVDDSDNDLY